MIAWAIATVGGVGRLKPAPGTWGSLVALPLFWCAQSLGFVVLLFLCVAVFFAGWWATEKLTSGQDDHDPSYIVVDEVIGQWLALLPLAYVAGMLQIDALDLWPGWITAFLAFRIFDIWKPGPVGWADRRGDALGVMLDDVIAGILAAGSVLAIGAVTHGVFMQ